MRRRCDSDKCALSTDKLQSILPSIFLSFIVTAPRGNNIFAVLSSPRRAGTISLPFYRHRAAREQYLCRFIVAAQRSCKCICYASEKRADYPAKRQTNAA